VEIPPISELDLPDDELLRRIVTAVSAHPEVREPLLRVLLTDEFLNLPAEVKELREETREAFHVVNERIDETNETMREQFQAVNERIEETNETMREQFQAVNERIDANTRSIGTLMGQVGELRGEAYERRCAERIDAVMIDHFDYAVLADRIPINRQLIQARRNALITREEYEGGRNVDIIVQEQAEGETPSRLAAIEVSVTFNEDDLENAAGRAATLARITGIPTEAFLITRNAWPERVAAAATRSGVTIVRRI
jgi:hypothetical protein